MKENYFTNQAEKSMKSTVEKAFNATKKIQKENANKAKTEEGKAEMLANIFASKK